MILLVLLWCFWSFLSVFSPFSWSRINQRCRILAGNPLPQSSLFRYLRLRGLKQCKSFFQKLSLFFSFIRSLFILLISPKFAGRIVQNKASNTGFLSKANNFLALRLSSLALFHLLPILKVDVFYGPYLLRVRFFHLVFGIVKKMLFRP